MPSLAALAAFLWFGRFLGPVAEGAAPEWSVPWVPALGVEFALRLDGLSLAFALLITGIGAIVLLYAAAYFRTDRRLGSLLVILVLFAISMLGLVLADDALTLFVFWEGTTVTSFLLVGFDHNQAKARAAALQALLVTGGGGLALLAGLLIMSGITDTYRLSEMNALGPVIRASPLYVPAFVLVICGCFAKSAQWPFHFWLPGAMAAPTPVSAYLHSATMVKAGVYLMARFTPALGGTDLWFWTLTLFGGFTMVLASVWALRQTDLKLMLAQTTVMGLGVITMLIGIGTDAAILAAMVFILVHALYKATLFLVAGLLDKGAGTREYLELGGLGRAMPISAGVAALAALSMAGLPPFFGFLGKELIYEATLDAPRWELLVSAAAIAANALTFAAAGIVALRPFFGAPRSPRGNPADPTPGLWFGPAVLAVLALLIGLGPAGIEHALIAPMLFAVRGVAMPGHLALWHGVTPALYLSLATFAAGIALYAMLDRLREGLAAAEPHLPATEGWYDAMIAGLPRLAGALTGVLQDGRMTTYLRLTFVALAALVWGAILHGVGAWPALQLNLALIEWAVVLIIAASTVAVLMTHSRLVAIAALGGVGAGIAVIFVLYGAIDVAMTQLFVEILVVVFISIAMVRLPKVGVVPFRPLNALIAGVLGIGMTLILIAVLGTELDPKLTTYFEANSVAVAHGHNIVNVILVDFRGFDTMGEISVIVIAGIAALAALRAGRRAAQ